MPFDNSTLSMAEIEALEHKYLMKYWFFLKFCEEEMVNDYPNPWGVVDK